jgi:hypothetical protein
MWTTRLAFSCPSLMDALLGFSAFHLRSLNASDKEIFKASHKYMLQAITGHAKQVRGGVDEKNAEAVFATSVFIAFHASMSQRFLEGSGPPGPPLHWFRPFQGLKAILEAGWEWISKSNVQPILQSDMEFVVWTPQQRREQMKTEILPFDFLLSGLYEEEQNEETIVAYEVMVTHLNFMNINPSAREVIRFSAVAPEIFIEKLEVRDPRALAIVGYFFMLLKRFDDIWWLNGVVEEEFKNLMEIMPTEWWPKMEWAVREFEARDSKT